MSSNSYIECGKIINTHGCYGGLKLESWCNTPEELAMLKKLYIKKDGEFLKCSVDKASVFKQFVIVTLNNVKSMDEALALKNTVVYALRKDFRLEEGEYFIADLSGLDVIDANSGKVYGTLLEVINRGASDIYVVKTDDGERMIPAVPEFIKSIDIKKGIFVTPISGMLD
ncbi:MAG: 16S rRNA processing protein RimM [Ruminococcaceae bacterium]|nr:16S rRNA processing protein RimM [Oscillospiraceae bacterium]